MANTTLDTMHQVDFNDMALMTKDIVATGAVYINGGALVDTDVGVLAGVTPGTATAEKAVVLDASKGIATITSATITTLTTSSIIRAGEVRIVPAWFGKAGAGAGWVVDGADDGLARLPAGQTDATLVIPITGLKVGDTVTAVGVNGQVESAGNNVTCVMSVRKATAAAGDFTDAEIGTDNVGTLTADTALSAANLGVSGLTEVLAATEYLYVLITATTAASTDIAIANLLVTVTTA